MGKWWSLGSLIIVMLIDIGLFYYIPNSLLLLFATFPYLAWWIGFSTKAHYLLLPLALLIIIFVFFAIPILNFTGIAEDILFFENMYNAIYPGGFTYAWSQQPPTALTDTLIIIVSFILWIKIMLWIINRIFRTVSKFNFMLALSALVSYMLFFQTLFGLLPALLGQGVYEWFQNVFVLGLFYDIYFVWFPFVVWFFILDWLINRILGN
jgi:hypothetical protein